MQPVTFPASPMRAILELVHLRRNQQMTLMGIGGCGGAGKSTLARRVAEEWPGTEVVATDAFWDGSSFDLGRLRTEVLDPLLANAAVTFDEWDWASKTRRPARAVRPEGLVVIEGVCALHQMFRDDLDIRLWVDAPREVRLERGVARDGEASRQQWETVWMPNEAAYIERDDPITCAHIVIDGTRPFG